MNGIIHVCAHPNDDDPTFRISDDKIFTDIFNYIEVGGVGQKSEGWREGGRVEGGREDGERG